MCVCVCASRGECVHVYMGVCVSKCEREGTLARLKVCMHKSTSLSKSLCPSLTRQTFNPLVPRVQKIKIRQGLNDYYWLNL